MRVDIPIVDAMNRLREKRLGAVALAAGTIADGMNQGSTAADAIRSCESPVIDQAAAAVQSWAEDPGKVMKILLDLT